MFDFLWLVETEIFSFRAFNGLWNVSQTRCGNSDLIQQIVKVPITESLSLVFSEAGLVECVDTLT